MNRQDVLIAIFVVFLWALNAILAKIGMAEIPPLEMTALRFLLIALVLFPFMRINKQQLPWLLAMSFSFGTIHLGLLFTALTMTDVGTAILLVQLGTPFATILAAIFLGEKMGIKHLVAFAVCFLGVIILVGGPNTISLLSCALLLASASGWAVTQILVKKGPPIASFPMAGWLSLLSFPQVCLLSLLLENHQVEAIVSAGWRGWNSVIYSALVSSIIAYGLWYILVKRCPMGQLMPFSLLNPVFTLLLGIVILGDSANIYKMGGGLIVIVGVAILSLRLSDVKRWLYHPRKAKKLS